MCLTVSGDITSYLMGCPGGGHTVNYVRGHNTPFNLLSRGADIQLIVSGGHYNPFD